VHEIIARDGVRLEEIADLVINTVPDQGTATVRTEEAVLITPPPWTRSTPSGNPCASHRNAMA
jgi:hypothetical protein